MNQKDTPVSPLYYKILVTLMLALSIILGVWAAYSHLSARAYRTALQNTYCRAADSAADNLANLSDDMGGDEDTDFGRVLIGKRKQVAGVKGFLDARGEAGADAVVAFVFHGHRRIAFGDARGLVGDGGVGFGRSVSGEGGDGGQQQG